MGIEGKRSESYRLRKTIHAVSNIAATMFPVGVGAEIGHDIGLMQHTQLPGWETAGIGGLWLGFMPMAAYLFFTEYNEKKR